MPEISTAYQPGEVEEKWYARWVESGCFHGDEASEKDAFSIVIPPPNVTGILHLGHVLNNTIQDVLARRARMQGKAVLWLPGTDHAGIATQTKVEQKLRKEEGKTRRDLGREAFLKEVWTWKEKHGGIIIQQLKRLGCSCDWDRERFTMDEDYSRWISHIFVELFREGLIYRGKRMVNWCPASLTALSDEEVIMKPQKSKLYYMRYEIEGVKGKYVEIATTRPETLMGDTAVAVNPNDPRYAKYLGKNVWRPFPRAKIPIIADEHIDPEFGTGVLKVTPAHDKADFDIGQRHGLEIIDVLHPDGTLNDLAGEEFSGLDRFVAREKAAEKLEEMGLLVKVEDYENSVGFSERADVPIEPRLSMQWFLRYPAVKEATDAVANGEIRFRPERWSKTYLHWMENIQDWCISRQLWWGHRIPVWYRKEKAEALQAAESPEAEGAGQDLHVSIDPPEDPENWVQDGDVLDTWFSSWLWPFATMTPPEGEASATLKKFYPTSDLVTGPDIIFFWVARMIMAGYRFQGELPFRNVFFTSIIRDKQGRKLAKQLGNSPDPLDLMADYGADGLRFGMMRIAPIGQDIRFDVKQIEEGRNFANKLWNAARYRQMQGEASATAEPGSLSLYALDILGKLSALEENLERAYGDYRFNEVAQLLYEFFWSQYCDWFLESAKRDFGADADPAARAATLATMDAVLKRFLMLLHPYMPHISEELWAQLEFGAEGQFLMQTPIPADPPVPGLDPAGMSAAAEKVAAIYEAVRKTRNLKAEYGLAANKNVTFILDPSVDWFAPEAGVFAQLAGAEKVELSPGYEAEKGVPAALTDVGRLYMPLEGLIDVEAERQRLSKELEKAQSELTKVAKKLQNENFVTRAPDEIIAEHRDRQKSWKSRVEELGRMIENLAGM